MTQLTDDLFAVEVPEGATNFRIMKFSQPETFSYDYSIQKGDRCTTGLIAMIDLPPGTWQILCTTKEASEEQAKGIVEHDTFIGGYKDYDTERFHHEDPFIKATDSLNSLITSKGLDVNKNYVLLKKEKP